MIRTHLLFVSLTVLITVGCGKNDDVAAACTAQTGKGDPCIEISATVQQQPMMRTACKLVKEGPQRCFSVCCSWNDKDPARTISCESERTHVCPPSMPETGY